MNDWVTLQSVVVVLMQTSSSHVGAHSGLAVGGCQFALAAFSGWRLRKRIRHAMYVCKYTHTHTHTVIPSPYDGSLSPSLIFLANICKFRVFFSFQILIISVVK